MLSINSPVPLYLQLKTLLRDAIENGQLPYGQKIPTEAELGALYGVSRVTVRKATNALVEDGLLTRKQGKGTFVSGILQHNLINSTLISWTADNQSRHHIPQTRCLSLGAVAGPAVEDAFGLQPGLSRQYLRAQRLRLLDDAPILCEYDYFPLPAYASLTPEHLNGSVFALLRQTQGVTALQECETVIRVARATAELATLLGVPADTALVHTRTSYCHTDGRIAFLSEQYINSEKYEIKSHGHTVTL